MIGVALDGPVVVLVVEQNTGAVLDLCDRDLLDSYLGQKLLDLRNPPGWRRPWADDYAATLDLVAEAERLGAGSVWVTEHHLFEDGYMPQPLTFLAALAARTSRVRLGTAVLLAALRHPRHVAEVRDVLWGGELLLAPYTAGLADGGHDPASALR